MKNKIEKKCGSSNPFGGRLEEFCETLRRRRLDAAVVDGRASIRGLTGVDCDSAALVVEAGGAAKLHTDFRYTVEIARKAPWLALGDIKLLSGAKPFAPAAKKGWRAIGCEFTSPHSRFLALRKAFPGARFADVAGDIAALRAVKTPEEIEALRRSTALNDAIWAEAQTLFKPGMSEADMARTIKRLMIERGDGEAFDTIVCIGANAAECHHVPDATRWNGKDAILVDMGVRLDGYCSDMTRCLPPEKPSRLYREAYSLVKEANALAAAALKPGMTGSELDGVARRFLAKNGYKKEFGHSLGHGVGIEIHEQPGAGRKSKTVFKPGMSVTIEPGLYLPGKLGVRIEDLAIVTRSGCEILTASPKAALPDVV